MQDTHTYIYNTQYTLGHTTTNRYDWCSITEPDIAMSQSQKPPSTPADVAFGWLIHCYGCMQVAVSC